ncbi:MAG: hypothetical protein KAX44_03645 [Candidatus Brocadiae bacterium]|nr:hypothetical protein [Candidatus Brocadiia bacterium]
MAAASRILTWARKRLARILLLFALVLALLFLFDVGKSVQIHTVRGDLRFRFLGLPYDSRRQRDEDVRLLQEIALGPPEVRGEWHRCGQWHRRGRAGYRDYTFIAALARVDQRAARFCLEDEVSWITRTKCDEGCPLAPILSFALVGRDDQGRWAISPEWWRNETLRGCFEEAGYAFSESQDGNANGT